MRVAIINDTIRAICLEVEAQGEVTYDWKSMTEEELLYEAAICIFSSQILFETAVAAASQLRDCGLLHAGRKGLSATAFERNVVEVLSGPLLFTDSCGVERCSRVRFKNRLASLFTSTVINLYDHSRTINGLLVSAQGAKSARESMIQHVWGFGPKQASLFLRRVGYCSNLAVLDVHVLDYLRLARGISSSPSRLGRLSCYEKIEEEFRAVATDFGYSLGCVDLATWVTMRVAKREAIL